MLTITAIIPTYHRPNDLARCLDAFKQQTRPAEQVIIVVRDGDTKTWQFLQLFSLDSLPLHMVTVTVPGVIAAMNAGLKVATGDIVAFTDDDAAPHPDWLERIETWFESDEQLGGVGGRDWQYQDGRLKEPGERRIIGQLQWFGRVIGDHHLAIGAPQLVDVLKGVNMAYRRSAIVGMQFDERMRGTGAQAHFELAFTLPLRRQGWKLLFDPQVAVDHFPAPRFDEDQRGQFNTQAWLNAVHNETVALLQHLTPFQRFAFVVWTVFVGSRLSLGFVQLLRFLPSEGKLAVRKCSASLQGRWQGYQTWQRSISHYKFLAQVSQGESG